MVKTNVSLETPLSKKKNLSRRKQFNRLAIRMAYGF